MEYIHLFNQIFIFVYKSSGVSVFNVSKYAFVFKLISNQVQSFPSAL